MGSSSSKSTVESSSSSSQNGRRNRLIGGSSRSFQCSCLGQSSGSYDNDNDDEVSYGRKKEIRSLSNEISCSERTRTESNQVKHGRKDKVRNNANEVPSINNDVDCHEWDGDNVSRNDSRADNSYSEVTSNRSLAPSDRSRSRFSFFPGSISFRLSRAASLGSSSAYSLFPNGLRDSNTEEGFPVNTGLTTSSINGNGAHLSRDLLPIHGINRLPVPQYEETTSSSGLQLENPDSRPPVHLQNGEIISTRNIARDNENDGFPADQNGLRSLADIENTEARRPDRRVRAREPVERSVRFSRTLSVGRLRDRVLRRSSFSEALFGRLQDDRETRDSSQDNRGQVWGGMARSADLNGSAETMQASSNYPTSSELNSMYNGQNYDVENPRSRDGRYQDIVERRTDFLERRRRIRSQVRALQRLGSRFENLSGHERSCILSGQHRTGRCTCRTTNRATNPDDDTNARASISRIVMLAEALFEVLDEIHQQSVVLSSRPSVSSIGSVPAPKEVVESMPVKIFKKSQKSQNEDAAQCYICLVEYEEGDSVRILPCHHEFHQMCIDKWLKEIHRVCPLCRGDVCRTNSLATEN